MNPKMPFKNCDPFKAASEQDYGSNATVQRKAAGLSRIVEHVSGHPLPHYLLILLGDTRVQ
jgi:hypothetical protein